jgi:hypothetical protein
MGPSISIRSRSGNIALAVLGVTYVVSAIALAARFLQEVWQALSLVEMGVGTLLLVAAVCGAWLTNVALKAARPRGLRAHRTAPAAGV